MRENAARKLCNHIEKLPDCMRKQPNHVHIYNQIYSHTLWQWSHTEF